MDLKKFSLLFFLVLISSTAYSEVLVKVAPTDLSKDVLTLYPDEVVDFKVIVLNTSGPASKVVNLKIEVDEGLALVNGFQDSRTRVEEVQLPGYNQVKNVFFKLKAKSFEPKKHYVTVYYGFKEYNNLAATYLNVVENPVVVLLKGPDSAVNVNEVQKIGLSVFNNSSEEIKNLRAELVVPQGLDSRTNAFFHESLKAGDKIGLKEFEFSADSSVSGSKELLLRLSYEDSNGTHFFEKKVEVEFSQATVKPAHIIVFGLIVIIAYLVFRQLKKPRAKPVPEQDTEYSETVKEDSLEQEAHE